MLVTLRAKLSGAVYCYRSCLWRAGGLRLFVGLLPRSLESACIDLHQNGSVGKGSDHLQLIKFRPSRAPREGGMRRDKFFWLRLTTASAQCLRLSERFLFFFSSHTTVTKYQGEPHQRGIKYKGWEHLANIAFYLGNGIDRVIVTMEH